MLPDFKPVLVVDTDEAGYFGKYTEKELEHVQENLANRLLMEVDMRFYLEHLVRRF